LRKAFLAGLRLRRTLQRAQTAVEIAIPELWLQVDKPWPDNSLPLQSLLLGNGVGLQRRSRCG
jgi:hypothetical protein